MTGEDWDRQEPPEQLDWVDGDMREIRNKWILWNKYHESWGEMIFTEGQYTMNEGEDDPEFPEEKVEYQDVSVMSEEGLHTIGDDFVFYDRQEAEDLSQSIWDGLLPSLEMFDDLAADQPLIQLVAFRHGGSDWGSACSVEWDDMSVNRLGLGIVIRRDLLERLNIPYHKYEADDNDTE